MAYSNTIVIELVGFLVFWGMIKWEEIINLLSIQIEVQINRRKQRLKF